MKRCKKKSYFLFLTILSIFVLGASVFATSINWSVNLPPWGGNVVLINDTKSSTSSYATNRVDFIGGPYPAMEVWMKVEGKKVYGKAKHYKGEGTYTMPFGGSKSAGTAVEVIGENASNTYVNVSADGYCDIK